MGLSAASKRLLLKKAYPKYAKESQPVRKRRVT